MQEYRPPRDEPDAEAAQRFIAGIVRGIDPTVRPRVHDYRWHGQWIFNVSLSRGDRSTRLEITRERLDAAHNNSEPLRHDLEKALMDLGDTDLSVY